MDFIACWIIRLCELRDAIAQGQVTGFTLIPNFLSALQAKLSDFHSQPEQDHSITEYALAVAALAVAAFAAYYTAGASPDGVHAALASIAGPLRFT